MAGTNPTPPVEDDDKPVTEDDLRALKYPDEDVDPPKEEDEPSEDDEPADDPDEPDDEPDDPVDEPAADEPDNPDEPAAFVKEFPNIKGDTPEEYAKNLEISYRNSTGEALRLKDELDKNQPAPPVAPPTQPPAEGASPAPKSAAELYADKQLNKEITAAYDVVKENYPQVSEPDKYAQFTAKVAVFSRTILETENRLADPSELYDMATTSLGWKKKDDDAPLDDKDKLAMAAKDSAASSKTTSGPTPPKPKTPKVSEAQLKLNRKMYPGKTDKEIIEELTPYLK